MPTWSQIWISPATTILAWVAISSSRRSSQPRDRAHISSISFISRHILYHWIWQAYVISLGFQKGRLSLGGAVSYTSIQSYIRWEGLSVFQKTQGFIQTLSINDHLPRNIILKILFLILLQWKGREKKEKWVFFPSPENKEDKENSEQIWTILDLLILILHVCN